VLYKSHCQYFENLRSIFSQLKAKFDPYTLFSQGTPKLHVEQHIFVLKNVLLNSHTWCELIPSTQ
jgi:hypothetical protein